jgi:serine protease Do
VGTAGIVSAKERVLNSGPYDDFIQTDASINPGNSGGPLFNIRGEVIGINTAIVAHGRGIGFAIPINLARDILPQLEKAGKVTRGWLGVSIQKIDPLLAESFGLEESKGALVADVMKDTPASRAGIERGDVIIEFNKKPVDDFHDLPAMVATVPPGETVPLKVLREGDEIELEVTVDELKEDRQARAEPAPKADIVGLQVKPVSPEQAEALGLEEAQGVIVSEVGPASVAEEAGIQKGDVILEINRKPLAGIADYREAMKAVEEDGSVLLLIRRKESSFYVALNLD